MSTLSNVKYFFLTILYTCLTGFLFAYHVHEKAIMTTILPMSFLAITSKEYARLFIRLCIYGHLGLLPLLHRPVELLFKVVLHFMYILWIIYELEYIHLYPVAEMDSTNTPSRSNPVTMDPPDTKSLECCHSNEILLTLPEWISIGSTSLLLPFSTFNDDFCHLCIGCHIMLDGNGLSTVSVLRSSM